MMATLDRTGIPYWATVPIAGAICLGAGFLFGLPALRLEGLYLALATFALAVATPQILKFRGFGVSAMYAGIAGALGALLSAYVSPDSFPAFFSIKFLVGSVVRGIASISGVLIGHSSSSLRLISRIRYRKRRPMRFSACS
jgi:ABC-type branched-subunit amino acid transport system permease subunit